MECHPLPLKKNKFEFSLFTDLSLVSVIYNNSFFLGWSLRGQKSIKNYPIFKEI